MGFFDLKAICSVCNKEIGLNRYQIANKGWICKECLKKCGFSLGTPVRKMTVEDIHKAINTRNEKEEELSLFNSTKKIGNIEFDDNQRKWLVKNKNFVNKNVIPKIYNYKDIVDFELLEDGESIAKGGLGRAVAGGILFGGVGAIVGGVTGGKKSKPICTSLKIKITINDINNPAVYVDFINTSTKKSSFVYKTSFDLAQKCLSTLQVIVNGSQEEIKETPISSDADEILKFKNLLDQGIITQEEFEAKKKQLLGL
ncbi:DUF4428 domain-containing protein [Clostridium beijerinckii]|uniref:DUF4428 domain-containing protein n=1 Tax=Clostridium beijerinckii TaxID=1520 RepID=A0A7X9XQD0_CLOBE|nr:DUF4428 domain-containing protein [Clostridium beijerinckii]NMF06243.1 DUF4428 domain-containing protein [Clostridium beijerinckii]